jgi:hypothetical protein
MILPIVQQELLSVGCCERATAALLCSHFYLNTTNIHMHDVVQHCLLNTADLAMYGLCTVSITGGEIKAEQSNHLLKHDGVHAI